MKGSMAIVKCLEAEGVKCVFGYPGIAVCPLFDSLLDSHISPVLVRNEQNAAHSASGYARTSGKIGVCIASSGPGATNLITGIATAFADSIPLICITGQVKSEHIGSDMFQEADIVGATESFVKYSYLVKNVNDIPRVMKEAFYIAQTGRKGPVLIDMPIDIQKDEITSFTYPEEVHLRTYKPTVKGHSVQIKKVMMELEKAQRPILCVGGGVILSGAQKEIIQFAEKIKLPMVSTMMGIGVLPSNHFLNIGMVGNNGKKYANRAINESDVLIMVGARVADRAVKQPDLVMQNKVLIHIDIDPAEIGKNAGPSIPLVGDAKNIFRELNRYEADMDFSDWLSTLEDYKNACQPKDELNEQNITPSEIVRILSQQLPDDAIYVADVGQNQIWSCNHYIVKKGKFLTSGGMGTMGYSIPAAIGAKMAAAEKCVVAVCGDGSFQMALPELATLIQEHLNVKILVMNNQCLGMIREYQHKYYENRYTMYDLSAGPNLQKIAEAYGINYMCLKGDDDIERTMRVFLTKNEPVILECMIDSAGFTAS